LRNSIGNPGGEYGDSATTRLSNGRMPDLNLFENPWIGSTTMEWRNHAIAEQTDETKTRPSEEHKGEEDDPVIEM
jgi:hypothetical protein